MTAETQFTQGSEVPQRLPGVPHNLGVDRRAAQELLRGEAPEPVVAPAAAPTEEPAPAAAPDTVPAQPAPADFATTSPANPAPSEVPEAPTESGPAAPESSAPAAESDDLLDVPVAPVPPVKLAQPEETTKAAPPVATGNSQRQSERKGFADRFAARLEERAAEVETRPAAAQAGNRKPYRKDFTVTVLLLAVATFGALTLGQSLLFLPQQMHQMVAALPQHNLTVPSWVTTAGQVGALVILSLYAMTLLFTISRLRARKLAFWAPLSAGLLAVLVTTGFIVVAMTATIPLAVLNDPAQMQTLLDAINANR